MERFLEIKSIIQQSFHPYGWLEKIIIFMYDVNLIHGVSDFARNHSNLNSCFMVLKISSS